MTWLARVVVLLSLWIGLPLLGAWLAGRSIEPYLEFPPVPTPGEPTSFSWVYFAVTAFLIVVVLGPFIWRVLSVQSRVPVRQPPARGFPVWGWLGIGFLAVAWILAWTRFPWFAELQPYTFTPLWLGYVIVTNALTWQRTGACMMTHRTGYWLALFLVSTVFWWLFEYLNLFAQNWYYTGERKTPSPAYFFSSSLSFATVLPAVLGTRDWLASFPRLTAGLHDFWQPPLPPSQWLAWILLLLGAISLFGIGLRPEQFYPMLWLAPLFLLLSLEIRAGRPTLLDAPRRGDWTPLWLGALAALVCGFFWEMWNNGNLSQWHYVVPYVDRFRIFHMPLLGYSGYLPFGLTCIAAADFFLSQVSSRPANERRLAR